MIITSMPTDAFIDWWLEETEAGPMQWRHSICDDCWTVQNPDRLPVRVVLRPVAYCCFCGAQHRSGIFVRAHPDAAPHCRCSAK